MFEFSLVSYVGELRSCALLWNAAEGRRGQTSQGNVDYSHTHRILITLTRFLFKSCQSVLNPQKPEGKIKTIFVGKGHEGDRKSLLPTGEVKGQNQKDNSTRSGGMSSEAMKHLCKPKSAGWSASWCRTSQPTHVWWGSNLGKTFIFIRLLLCCGSWK